jgi:hypothetical protein
MALFYGHALPIDIQGHNESISEQHEFKREG